MSPGHRQTAAFNSIAVRDRTTPNGAVDEPDGFNQYFVALENHTITQVREAE